MGQIANFIYTQWLPDYIIAFNTGAVFNVIHKWIKGGMSVLAETIKENLSSYLANISHINLSQILHSNFLQKLTDASI